MQRSLTPLSYLFKQKVIALPQLDASVLKTGKRIYIEFTENNVFYFSRVT